MEKTNRILACVDSSIYAEHVADCAIWVASRLSLPLEFISVIDKDNQTLGEFDHSGALNLNAEATLLQKLSEDDKLHNRQAIINGRIVLNHLLQKALASGLLRVDTRLRHGELLETLVENSQNIDLMILGRRGQKSAENTIGSNVENIVRSTNKPILLVPENFKEPRKILILFDKSKWSKKMVNLLSLNSILQGLELTLVAYSDKNGDKNLADTMDEAKNKLEQAGYQVSTIIESGSAQDKIAKKIELENFDMLMMGAYTKSALCNLILGSKTHKILNQINIPALLIR